MATTKILSRKGRLRHIPDKRLNIPMVRETDFHACFLVAPHA